MTPEQFVYWLQGFAEMNKEPPTEEQWRCLQEHLKTVFTKVTPTPLGSYYSGTPLNVGKLIC